jgi:thiamine-phosphate pyrophosphorylase
LAVLPRPPFVYPIVDLALLEGRSAAGIVALLAEAGAAVIQLRAKRASDRLLLAEARGAVAAAHRHGALLVVNDRPDVAVLAGADGVHVGQDDLDPALVRPLLPEGALLGLSTHDAGQVARADAAPVDYVAVGPVFPTSSKERPDPVVGPELLRTARSLTRRPLVAIGGIHAGNAAAARAAGADGVAVISALLRAADPGAAFRELQAALQGGA